MAFILKDRVKESTSTTGTGAISLGGSLATFDDFQTYMSNGDTTYYSIAHTTAGTDEWEVGIGTWNTGNTLTRTTVLAGSNGTSAVDLSAGDKDIFITYPADKAVFKDSSGNIDADTLDGSSKSAVSQLLGRTAITSTTDLDTLSGHGWYGWGSNNPSNSPADYSVLRYLSDGSQDQQWVTSYGGAANKVELYGRRKTGGAWDTSWTRFWSTANHGSGSGLDADTLDGVQGSSFLRSDADDSASGLLTVSNDIFLGDSTSRHHLKISSDVYPEIRFFRGTNEKIRAGVAESSATYDQAEGDFYIYSQPNNIMRMNVPINGDPITRNNGSVTMWDSSNDGSGSGLDADTLDSYHASSFIRNNVGTTWTGAGVNAMSFRSLNDIETTSDGAALEVHQDNAGADAFMQFHVAGDFALNFGLDGSTNDLSVGGWSMGSGNKYKVWHAGNDGSGSGLDADTLDGKDRDNFGATLATYGTTSGTSGRIRCTAPFNTNSSHMFQVTVSIYHSYGIHNYVVGGYMYGSTNQWHSPTAIYSGTGTPDIKVGRDSSGKAYISIANGNYTGVRVHNMTLGYQTNVGDTYDPWTITIDAATENSVTPTVSKTWHSTNDGSGSGLDADLLDGVQGSSYLRSDADDTMSGALTVIGRLDVGNGSNGEHEIRIYKGDNNVSDHLQFYNGTTRVGEIGCEDTTWLRINQETAKNIYTPRYIRADGGFFVDGVAKGINGSGNFFGGTIAGASDYGTLLRSDANDSFSGSLTSTARNNGIFGTYDSYKTDHIWSMGTSYKNHASGTNFGNLYGLAYKHTNNSTGGTMASGHQMVWCQNGTPNSAMGTNIWTSGHVESPNLYVHNNIYHNGDTDTYLGFTDNTITISAGGQSEITANTTGVRLGDTGNGYFRPVSGNYGSIEIDGGAHGGWEGYSIGGRMVFMHNNGTEGGIYNDVNNEWMFYGIFNGETRMYHNGSYKGYTYSSGFRVSGNMLASSNVYAYYSDERLKAKDGVIENALDKINSLETFYYYENDLAKEHGHDNDKRQLGVSAQQVEAILPECVAPAPFDLETDNEGNEWSKSGEDYLTVDYPRLVPLLIKGIQEQQVQIEDLKKEVQELKYAITK